MIFFHKLRNYFEDPASKLARFLGIEANLQALEVRKLEFMDAYSEIQKASQEGLPSRITFEDYVIGLAGMKREGAGLTEIKKSLECDKGLRDLRKCNENKFLKSLYRANKLTLDLYNEAASVVKTKAGQVRYADVVVTCGDFLLLTKRATDPEDKNSGAWVVPGGHVDPGESSEKAAERELREETGLNIMTLKEDRRNYQFKEIGHYASSNADVVYYNLELENIFDAELVLDSTEVRDYEWVKISDVDKYPMIFDMKDNIKEYMGWDIKMPQDTIQKSRAAQIGEIRVWQGTKMRKEQDGWVLVKEGKNPKAGGGKGTGPKTPVDLTEHARRASQVALQNAVKMSPESEVRSAAAKELIRRKGEESGEEMFNKPEPDGGEYFNKQNNKMKDPIKKSRLSFVEDRLVSSLNQDERTLLAENFYDEYIAVISKSVENLRLYNNNGVISDEDFSKSIRNLSHLIPKKVQVKDTKGKIHLAIRWVDPNSGQSTKVVSPKSGVDDPNKPGFEDDDNFRKMVLYVAKAPEISPRDKVRSLFNLGIFDPAVLVALSGLSYSDVKRRLKDDLGGMPKLGASGDEISGDETGGGDLPKDKSDTIRDIIAEEQATRTPESIPESMAPRNLDNLWAQYNRNLKRVMTKGHKFCLAFGRGGLGKTFDFWKVLKSIQPNLREWNEEIQPNKEQYDFVFISGRISPGQVYAELYRHRDKLCVFDDCDSFLSHEDVQGFLKAGLDTGERCIISNKTGATIYEVQGDKESPRIPNSFNFTGRVIAITNLRADQLDAVVRSRAMTSDLTMTSEETIIKLGQIKDAILIFNSDKTEVVEVTQKARDIAYEAAKKYRHLLGGELNTRTYQTAILIADEADQEGLSDEEIMERVHSNFDSTVGTFSAKIAAEEKAKTALKRLAFKQNYKVDDY